MQVEGPKRASADANPFSLPEGAEYHVVHAEMMPASRWTVL